MTDTTKRIAAAFRAAMVAELGRDTCAAIDAANKAEASTGICHSHDHCDANMLMLDAIESVMGEMDMGSPEHTSLWNAAWDKAKAAGFAAIKAGDTVKIKPEFQDDGDDAIQFVAVDDADKGRVTIRANVGMAINPTQVVNTDWIA